jgi:hypothetical protein
MAHTRKLHYRDINASADQHTGRKGDIWFDPEDPVLRTYNGDPGGEPLGSGGLSESNYIDYGTDYTGGDLVIDLTKTYHWLVDLESGAHYVLPNGTQGQEIVFFACSGLMGAGQENSDIWVTSAKYYLDAGPSSNWTSGARVIRCFSHAVVPNAQGMVKALFVNGAWHFGGVVEDQGSW